MTPPRADGRPDDHAVDDGTFWREYLTHPDSMRRVGRHLFRRIPSAPRCRQCAAPFTGLGAPLMRLLGKRQSAANPNMCNSCHDFIIRHHGGADVEASLLFADVRGSTSLAEGMAPGAFRDLMDRFYATATAAVFAHDGMIDKFVGDELVAVYPPYLSGDRHSRLAVETAQALLQATGHSEVGGPWLPVGVGVSTGPMWFGAVGAPKHTEVTVLGDTVNTTARLASAARAGEILVSANAAQAAGLDPALERQAIRLKGKAEATEIVRLRVAPA